MSIFVFVVLFEAFHGAFLELARATLRGLLVEIHYEHYHMQAVSIAGIRCLKAEITMSVAIYIKSDTKIEAAGIQQNLDRNRD